MSLATVITAAYAVVSVLAAWVWVRLGRTRRPSAQERAAAARQRVGLTPDPRWGTDAAAQDACELLWDLPEYDPELDAGCDRLRQAIRDEQQKGEDA